MGWLRILPRILLGSKGGLKALKNKIKRTLHNMLKLVKAKIIHLEVQSNSCKSSSPTKYLLRIDNH